MELQGQDLSIQMRGEDVKLLQSELGKPGFSIPENEIQESFFGEGARRVVQSFRM